MKIIGLGLDLTGQPLFPPIEEDVFVKMLATAMEQNADAIKNLTKTTTESTFFRGEVERTTIDPGDPRQAGWTFLVNVDDPRRQAFVEILKPLALHRDMADPAAPLLYNSEPPHKLFDWLKHNYFALSLADKPIPKYTDRKSKECIRHKRVAASHQGAIQSFQSIKRSVKRSVRSDTGQG